MHWDEDIWEDISDPPSPSLGETNHLFGRCNPDGQQSDDEAVNEDFLNIHGAVEETKQFRRHSSDFSECYSLIHEPQTKSADAPPDLKDANKIAQQLLQSYQSLSPLRDNLADFHEKESNLNCHQTHPGLSQDEHQTYQETLSSNSKSFEAARTKSASDNINRTSQSNQFKDPAQRVSLKSNQSKAISSNQQSKSGVRTPYVNNTKVPQSLCNPTSSGHQVTALQSTSSNQVSSSLSDNSKDGFKERLSAKGYNLQEYKKRPSQLPFLDRYRVTNNNRTATRTAYADLYNEEEEDGAKAILCVVFCIMGLGLIVGIVCLISRYTDQAEVEKTEAPMDDSNYTDLMNEVYYRRVADVIRSAAKNEVTNRHHAQHPAIATDPASRQLCGIPPPGLLGNTTETLLNITVHIEDLVEDNVDVQLGGEWKPSICIPRHRVAIIIPYRDRWNHLKVLLYYLIPTLKRQQIHFRIFVVEQYGNETFNKGSIMNSAFREALKLFDFQCVAFHDVDLVPEDDRNMYTCTEQPKHMSHGIDKFQYILPYQGLVGGVLMFKREHFQLVNGYSNMYWGWGAEDDDMTTRILFRGLRIYRPPSNIAKYKMVKHDGRKSSEVAVRMKLLRSAARRSKLEGLNNVKYKLLFTHKEKLFTHFVVDVGNPLTASS